MSNKGTSFQNLRSIFQKQQRLLLLIVFGGVLLGVIWRCSHPLPYEASVQLPVVIRNAADHGLWDELKTDALYHSLYQIIKAEGGNIADQERWLELTEETFRLVVRHPQPETAQKMAAEWGRTAFSVLNSLQGTQASSQFVVMDPSNCYSDAADETEYYCTPDELLVGEPDQAAENNAFATLWIGEPENASLTEQDWLGDVSTAGIAGGLMGIAAGLFLLLILYSLEEAGDGV